MIRKTIIGLLVLATLGTVVLWAFAFFGGPYTTDWDLTERIWCMLMLAPRRCEVYIVRFPPMPEWPDPSTPAETSRAAILDSERRRLRFVIRQARLVRSPIRPTASGFAWRYSFAGYSEWHGMCPSWALLILAGLLGTYPAVVFIRRPFRRARRLRNGWCLGCGYDLQGNVSGVCPECGEAT